MLAYYQLLRSHNGASALNLHKDSIDTVYIKLQPSWLRMIAVQFFFLKYLFMFWVGGFLGGGLAEDELGMKSQCLHLQFNMILTHFEQRSCRVWPYTLSVYLAGMLIDNNWCKAKYAPGGSPQFFHVAVQVCKYGPDNVSPRKDSNG